MSHSYNNITYKYTYYLITSQLLFTTKIILQIDESLELSSSFAFNYERNAEAKREYYYFTVISTLLTSFCAVLPGIAGVPAVTVDTDPAYSPSRETARSQQQACGGTSGPLSEE